MTCRCGSDRHQPRDRPVPCRTPGCDRMTDDFHAVCDRCVAPDLVARTERQLAESSPPTAGLGMQAGAVVSEHDPHNCARCAQLEAHDRAVKARRRLEELREMRRDVMDRWREAHDAAAALDDELRHLDDELDELLRAEPDLLVTLGREALA